MNTIHQGLLVLIKSVLTGEKLPLPQGFTLEAAEELIRSQSLVPLVYRGAFNCGIDPKSDIMQRYQVGYFRHLVHGDQQIRAVEKIVSAFEENNIDYMPLKGCNLKRLYPRPELRTMADADILFRLEHTERIKCIMQELRYSEESESDHEWPWKKDEVYVELHKRLFAPSERDLYGYFGDGWGKAIHKAGHRYALSVEDEYIYLFTHMVKHFRFGGIGARQIVDLYVYREAYPDMDEARRRSVLEQLGLLDFHGNIERMLTVWFGDAPADARSDFITEFIFSAGNFGSIENRMMSVEAIESHKRGKIKHTKLRTLLRIVFPPLELMKLSYNVLYKYPILYPIFWPVRWIDVLLHQRWKIGKKLNIIQNMSDDKVTAHEKFMNLMGLNYDYGEEE